MTTFSLRAIGAGAVVGTAGAVFLYAALAPGADPYAAPLPVPTMVSTTPPSPVFRDCPRPASLEKGVCVTRISRTVTVTTTSTPVTPAGPGVVDVAWPGPTGSAPIVTPPTVTTPRVSPSEQWDEDGAAADDRGESESDVADAAEDD
ncbi:MAG: hypothetical protein U0Q21_01035 [Dermatophilaceae bacterium]